MGARRAGTAVCGAVTVGHVTEPGTDFVHVFV